MRKLKMKLCVVLALILVLPTFCIQSFSETDTSIQAQYKFDADFNDSSANANHATKSGDVQIVDDSDMGKCAEFKGGYLTAKSSPILNLGANFTFSVWIKIAGDAGNTNTILERLTSNNIYVAYYFKAKNGALLEANVNRAKSTSSTMARAGGLVLKEGWVLATTTYDGNNLKVFANGKLITDFPVPTIKGVGSEPVESDKGLTIGKSIQMEMFKGRMSDLRIYNKTLTDDEVTALYNERGLANNKIVLWIGKHQMMVDNKQVEVDPGNKTSPVIMEGRTLVPIRSIVETMGGKIGWDPTDRRVEVTLKDKVIKLWLDNTKANVNGNDLTLDVTPKLINGRTMLPLRFVSENLGAKLEWLGEKQQITILYSK